MMGIDDYFEPRELATAAKRRRVGRSFEREEGVTLAHALAYAWAVTGLPYHDSYADSLATRRPADLTRFVGRYLTGRPLVAGVLLPPGREPESAVMLQQFLDFMREDR
jgi:zinc protease